MWSGDVTVQVFDHQGFDTIESVSIEAPDFYTGEVILDFSEATGDDSFLFEGTIYNELEGGGDGEYPFLVRVTDTSPDQNLGVIDAWNVTSVPVDSSKGWARVWGEGGPNIGHDVAIDSVGDIYVVGEFGDFTDFDPCDGIDYHFTNGVSDAYITKFDSKGKHLWAETWGGQDTDGARGVAVDGSGYIYVTGEYCQEVDFDPGPGIDNHSSQGINDSFVSKFDTSGNFLWARTWGSTEGDAATDIAIDNEGNIYITGAFRGIVDFDPGPEPYQLSSAGNTDVFLSKFDSSGNFDWALTWGASSEDSGHGIATDESDDIFVTGVFNGSVDFDPGPGSIINYGRDSSFLSKFDSSGSLLWVKTWHDGQVIQLTASAHNVVTDLSENVYITGGFTELMDLDPGPGEDIYTTTGPLDRNTFLIKLNTSGEYEWGHTWGSDAKWDVGDNISFDEHGYISVTGIFGGTVDFDPGPGVDEHSSYGDYSIFISKFDTSGEWYWAVTFGGPTEWNRGYGVATDFDGNVYGSGFYFYRADFEPGPGVHEITVESGYGIYLIKLSPEGTW